MAPEEQIKLPEKTALSAVDLVQAKDKLSPPTAAKIRAFQDPTKASVVDFDKAMNSAEQGIRKAMGAVEKAIKEHKAEEQRKEAHEAKLKLIRSKKEADMNQLMEKAKREGEHLAEEQAAQEGISSSSSDSGESESGEGDPDQDEADAAAVENVLLTSVQSLKSGFSQLSPTLQKCMEFDIDMSDEKNQLLLSSFDEKAVKAFWVAPASASEGKRKNLREPHPVDKDFGSGKLPFMEDLLWGRGLIMKLYQEIGDKWLWFWFQM